ncbi:MAG: efflux RND transporter periplasmic adaptor subunit [Deltaproteobacteria bacterium]
MNKKKLAMAAGLLGGLIVLIVWIQGGFLSKIEPGTIALLKGRLSGVRTVPVKMMREMGNVTVSGTVEARRAADISSRISGYILALKVHEGDHVKKGEELLRIDTRALKEQADRAQAALDKALADVANAQRNYHRYKALLQESAISVQAFDDIQTSYEVAKAAVEQNRAAVEQARTQLRYGTVRSPFNGIVSKRVANIGDLAEPGRTLLSVYKPDTLELVAAPAERYSPYLNPGTRVVVDVPSLHLKQTSFIREVVPQRNPEARTITVKAPLPHAKDLMPGTYGTLTFATRHSEALVIPAKAVVTTGQLKNVKVLKNGMVEARYVKIGRHLGKNEVEVLSGLKLGEKVVIE